MEKVIYGILKAILPASPGTVPDKVDNYIIYGSDSLKEHRSLKEHLGLMDHRFDFDIYCKTYANLMTYFYQVRDKIKSIENTTQGAYRIQQVDIDPSAPELWEEEIQKHRKILTVTISYQEV